MFDTQYDAKKNGLSGCVGLGGCNNHRARAAQAEAHYNSLSPRIAETRQKIAALETGTLQAEYVSLEEMQIKQRKHIAELDNAINKATITRDMWLQNPEVASATGLGFFKKMWNKAFSCDTYTDREKAFKERSLPLEKDFAAEQKKLEILQTKFSPSNMNLIRTEAQKLTNEVKIREKKLTDINNEIENIKTAYNARKEAERLALEQQAQEAEKLKNAPKSEAKQGNMMGVVFLAALVVAGAYVFKSPKTAKVNA